jgi:uncharacterized membrane protein YraQ (UPF0718 family)
MGGYFRIVTAIPGFFLSSLILMLLWNANIHKLFSESAVKTIDYPAAMFITIIAWLTVAPLAAGGFRPWHK